MRFRIATSALFAASLAALPVAAQANTRPVVPVVVALQIPVTNSTASTIASVQATKGVRRSKPVRDTFSLLGTSLLALFGSSFASSLFGLDSSSGTYRSRGAA